VATGATAVQYTVFNINLLEQIVGSPTILTSTYTLPNVALSVGDGAFALLGGNSSSVATISIWKAINSAILGPSQSSVSKGGAATVQISNGFFQTTPLKGTITKSFTMKSSANIYGNNGTMIAGGGVSQQGM